MCSFVKFLHAVFAPLKVVPLFWTTRYTVCMYRMDVIDLTLMDTWFESCRIVFQECMLHQRRQILDQVTKSKKPNTVYCSKHQKVYVEVLGIDRALYHLRFTKLECSLIRYHHSILYCIYFVYNLYCTVKELCGLYWAPCI